MVDKTDKHFDNFSQENSNDENIGIDFAELDAKMEELVYAIKDFTINNIRNENNIKEAEKVKKQKKPVKKLDVEKIRKAIIEATEIAKSKSTINHTTRKENNKK